MDALQPDNLQGSSLSRYIRVSQALQFYPFRRSHLYELMRMKAVRSFLMIAPGARRGQRLIDRYSLEEYLDQRAREAGLP
jgi:hypothetical protein